MKRLILLRHAKSDWDAPYDTDHGRPLAPRGERAARVMGRILALAGEAPEMVITSSALRARTTAELAAAAGGWECPIEVTDDLYGAGPGQVIGIVQDAPDRIERLLLVGHEPTWSSTAGILIGGGAVAMKTATAAGVDIVPERWADTAPGRGTLAWLLTPRLFIDGGFDLG